MCINDTLMQQDAEIQSEERKTNPMRKQMDTDMR
jgi:hypothetical protein